jgi:cytochrome P450/NADPH-cytochrome P450 reductase
MANPIPIPGPPGLPILGNIYDLDYPDTVSSLSRLADTYGPCLFLIVRCFKLTLA